MLSVSHAATGALIASKLPHPLLFIPLAIGAHFLEDWTPHWDVGTGLTTGKRTKRDAFILAIIDLIAAAAVVYFFWQKGHTAFQTTIWLGAVSGLLVDLMDAPRIFLNIHPKILQPLHTLHESVHHSIPNIAFGLAPQIVLLGVIYFIR